MTTLKIITVDDLNQNSFNNDGSFQKGGITVAISPAEGNLLKQYPNGLYVGTEAKENTSNLFVDSQNGSDTNTGTRVNPLRTIKECFIRNEPNTSFTINLMEGQTHGWRSSWLNYTKNKNFTIKTYGESIDAALTQSQGNWNCWRSKEILRATVQFICDSIVNLKYAKPQSYLSGSGNLTNMFMGVIIDSSHQEPSDSVIEDSIAGYIGNEILGQNFRFIGCEFKLHNRIALFRLGDISTIRIDACQFNPPSNGKLIQFHTGANLNLVLTNNNQTDGSEYSGSTLHKRGTPARQVWQDLLGEQSQSYKYTIYGE